MLNVGTLTPLNRQVRATIALGAVNSHSRKIEPADNSRLDTEGVRLDTGELFVCKKVAQTSF